MKEKQISGTCGFCSAKFSRMLKVKYFPNDGDWGFSHAFNNLCNDCLKHYVEQVRYVTCECGTIYEEQNHALNKECSDAIQLRSVFRCSECTDCEKKESDKKKKTWW